MLQPVTKISKSNLVHQKHKILLVITTNVSLGGGEIHALSLYKNLVANGHKVVFLVAKGSVLDQKLKNLNISHYTYWIFPFSGNALQPWLSSTIYKICKKEAIDIINCNVIKEINPVKKAAKKLGIKAIFTRHLPQPVKQKYLDGLDAVIGVSPEITQKIQSQNDNQKLGIKEITFIAPFFDEEKFLNFTPTSSKNDFFEKNFNLKLKGYPLLCMIGNMDRFDDHKNHPLLFNAIKKLVYEKNRLVEVVLVGSGKYFEAYKKIVKDLNIQEYMYFLGYTNLVPEILYHSDIKVLTSRHEAFGIVLLEAALLKKPIIWPTQTCAANVAIFDNQTGILFENNNVHSLVSKIELLINNPELGQRLGKNAFNFVKENFCAQTNIQKFEQLLDNI